MAQAGWRSGCRFGGSWRNRSVVRLARRSYPCASCISSADRLMPALSIRGLQRRRFLRLSIRLGRACGWISAVRPLLRRWKRCCGQGSRPANLTTSSTSMGMAISCRTRRSARCVSRSPTMGQVDRRPVWSRPNVWANCSRITTFRSSFWRHAAAPRWGRRPSSGQLRRV